MRNDVRWGSPATALFGIAAITISARSMMVKERFIVRLLCSQDAGCRGDWRQVGAHNRMLPR